ncbi:MAG: hypothetical protein D6694_10530 [Gammaproteobacteria bacterium]|nr:MAG: hypothetical protein D6694_10530 [Gammaproteobacteria bacterium]
MVELTFITSSKIKRAHAEYLCREYDVKVGRQRHYGVGYAEPRIQDREELLEQSIQDAMQRWRKNVSNPDEKFFFIEDTSVIVHCLSAPDREVPGVDVKYWMQENDFASIDRQLKAAGNDRRVTVRSDLLLTLSKRLAEKLGKPYVRFTSQVQGHITEREYQFDTNPLYPWLDNKTFNKWFVPEGSDRPISMLSIEDADRFDFRAGAFNQMLAFLEQHGEIKRRGDAEIARMFQASLPIFPPLFVVCGPTCAGKTTLAEFVTQKYGYYHIEASDFMHLAYYERHGADSPVGIADFALKALKERPSIVAEKILEFIAGLGDIPIILTGFRAREEFDYFKDKYNGRHRPELIVVDADEITRLQRYLDRNRGGNASKERFLYENQLQDQMGLDVLMRSGDAITIVNEGNFCEFYSAFDAGFSERLDNCHPLDCMEHIEPSRLEDAILLALEGEDNAGYTSAGIAKLIKEKLGVSKSKNNVSRYFNQRYHSYYEVQVIDGVKRFRLSQTGRMQAMWLRRKLASSG